MKTIYNLKTLWAIILGLFVFVSCNDSDDDIDDGGENPPDVINLKIEFTSQPVVSQNTISYTWAVENGDDVRNYTFQISPESDFPQSNYLAFTVTDTEITVEDLGLYTKYYARVRANISGGSVSEWVYASEATTGDYDGIIEILYDVEESDISGADVTIRFNGGKAETFNASYIEFAELPRGTEEIIEDAEPSLTIELDEEDLEREYIAIELKSRTLYQATMYGIVGDGIIKKYNSVLFTTGATSSIYLYDDEYLGDFIFENGTQEGLTYILPDGYNNTLLSEDMLAYLRSEGYGYLEIVTKNFVVTTENDTDVVTISLNMTMRPMDGVEKLTFNNITFSETSERVLEFGFSEAAGTQGSFIFTNCTTIDNRNGFLYSPRYYTHPNEVVIENCMFIWTDASSTLGNSESFLNGYLTTSGANPCRVRVENCTFVDMTMPLAGTQYFYQWYMDLSITNCSFIGTDRVADWFFRFSVSIPYNFVFCNNLFTHLPGTDYDPTFRPFITAPNVQVNNYDAADHNTSASRGNIIKLSYDSDVIIPGYASGDYTISSSVYTPDGEQLSTLGIGDLRWSAPGTEPAPY
ncbi:MAG: fibronectin type III domain-containing protein [Rikenellaceae bacterium]|nr:fibronectin type III domain-containing protein [Rikenellaceae bacterium]